ncbi:MAG: DNA repair protein RecN, partial [Actinomycetota bacterium]
MLEELHIRDLGVIAEARLEFAPGLNVLTGETGTGKTLVVGALGALLGARTEAGHVRSGAEQAFVEARFSASGGWAALGIEGDELVLARGIPGRKGGKGRVFLQGRMAAPGVLAEVARGLVEIQSQRDSHRLLKTAEQRDLLDRFAGDEALSVRSELAGAVSDMRRSQAELEELVGRERERARELESLRYEIEEIRQADIDPGEESRLESEESLLANAERLRETAEQARETLAGEQGAQASVGSARRQLGAVAEMDPILGEAARRLEQAGYEIEDVASGLRRHAESLEANPERLESVRRRRRLLGELKRKYGANLEEVMRYREQAERRWADLEGAQEGRVKLEWEITRLRTRRDGLAVRLSSHREKAAKRLCRAVGQELRDLAMDAARVDVVFHRRG